MRLAFALVLLMLGSPALTALHAADTKPPSSAAPEAAPAARLPGSGTDAPDPAKSPSGGHRELGVPKTLRERTATFSFPEILGWPLLGTLLGGAAALGAFTVLHVKRETSERPRRPDAG
jgi:hypothetical protein